MCMIVVLPSRAFQPFKAKWLDWSMLGASSLLVLAFLASLLSSKYVVATWQLTIALITILVQYMVTPAFFLSYTSLVCVDALLSVIHLAAQLPLFFYGDPPMYKRQTTLMLMFYILRPLSAFVLAIVSAVCSYILLSSCYPPRSDGRREGELTTGLQNLTLRHPPQGPFFSGPGRTLLDDEESLV